MFKSVQGNGYVAFTAKGKQIREQTLRSLRSLPALWNSGTIPLGQWLLCSLRLFQSHHLTAISPGIVAGTICPVAPVDGTGI